MLPLLLFEWWIALFLWPGVPRSALIVVSVYFGLIFLMFLLTLVLRAFNIIVAVGRPRGTSPVLLALAGILLWPTICFVTALAQQRTVSVAEWKIAGLLAALAFLLSIFSRLIEDPPLLGSLITLRRDIALGHIEVQPALRQLDFIIAGMQPSDMLEREVEKLLTLLREQTEELRAIVTESNAMRVAIVEAAGRGQTLLAKDDIGRWYKPHQASLTAHAEAVGRELDKYYRRARWLVAGDPVAKAKGNDIRTRISEEINVLSQQGTEMRNSVDALLRETLAKRKAHRPRSRREILQRHDYVVPRTLPDTTDPRGPKGKSCPSGLICDKRYQRLRQARTHAGSALPETSAAAATRRHPGPCCL